MEARATIFLMGVVEVMFSPVAQVLISLLSARVKIKSPISTLQRVTRSFIVDLIRFFVFL